MQSEEFIRRAKDFKSTLTTARDFDEMRSLWMGTNLAYHLESKDPFSSEYRSEVMEIYSILTEADYSPLNELTSTKQSSEQFEIGFPWVSRNLEIISSEIAKVIQAMRALQSRKLSGGKLIEFGAGWGNLALPLARAGQTMSAVDIDEGFLTRIQRFAAKENLNVECFLGDFLDVSRSLNERFDGVIFQSSFHHCLNFMELLDSLRDRVLTESGCIIFISEPITRNLPFPWGLRYDGESLWAIMCNKWLELGFDAAFFRDLMLKKGYLLSMIDPIPTVIGEGWIAGRGPAGIPFEQWSFAEHHSQTFHASDGVAGYGRFCREESTLPGLQASVFSNYDIVFQNFHVCEIGCTVSTANGKLRVRIPPGATESIRVNADCDSISIQSDTYVPDKTVGNGDTRSLGPAIKTLSLA